MRHHHLFNYLATGAAIKHGTVALVMLGGYPSLLHADSGTRITGAAGDWSDPTQWVDGIIASGADSTATFNTSTTSTIYPILDIDTTVGHLVFNTPGRYRIEREDGGVWHRFTLETTSGTPSITTHGYTNLWCLTGGTQGFDKFGTGTLDLSRSGNYTGVTTIREGRLEAWDDNALGATGAGNQTVVLSGAQIFIPLSTIP